MGDGLVGKEQTSSIPQLGKTSKKAGGPYSLSERAKRRAEVYRLHMLNGVPAVRIAELMEVDKNTIYADIRHLYSEVGQDMYRIDYDRYLSGQMGRLFTQRERLMGYLSDAKTIDTKLAIERQLMELEYRLTNIAMKIQYDYFSNHDKLLEEVNEQAKKIGIHYRFTSIQELIQIPAEKRSKMDKELGIK